MTLTAENVGLYAETLVRQVAAGGASLDYSEASLTVLDQLFQEAEAGYVTLPEAHQGLVVFYNGCYLGEVLARVLGAQWQFVQPWNASTMLLLGEHSGLEVRPFEKVQRRLVEGAEGNSFRDYLAGLRDGLQRTF